MKNEELCLLFVSDAAAAKGKRGSHLRVSADGKRLYSYRTCICERRRNGTFVVNTTKYSLSTSRHLRYLWHALAGRRVKETTKKVPRDEWILTRVIRTKAGTRQSLNY